MLRLRRSLVVLCLAVLSAAGLRADSIYFNLANAPLLQDWSDPDLITAHDDWSGVPSIVGYRGNGLATAGTSPRDVLAMGGAVDVIANLANTNSSTGGVAEFDALANPTVALQGSGTASAPFLLFHLDASGVEQVNVSYRLRDLDGSDDNAVQGVALQYRIGEAGNFVSLDGGWVFDATAGPNLSGLITPVSVLLPAEVGGAAQLQVRILTADAIGSDEWVGIDDIVITGARASATVPEQLGMTWLLLPLAGLGVVRRWTVRAGPSARLTEAGGAAR